MTGYKWLLFLWPYNLRFWLLTIDYTFINNFIFNFFLTNCNVVIYFNFINFIYKMHARFTINLKRCNNIYLLYNINCVFFYKKKILSNHKDGRIMVNKYFLYNFSRLESVLMFCWFRKSTRLTQQDRSFI